MAATLHLSPPPGDTSFVSFALSALALHARMRTAIVVRQARFLRVAHPKRDNREGGARAAPRDHATLQSLSRLDPLRGFSPKETDKRRTRPPTTQPQNAQSINALSATIKYGNITYLAIILILVQHLFQNFKLLIFVLKIKNIVAIICYSHY